MGNPIVTADMVRQEKIARLLEDGKSAEDIFKMGYDLDDLSASGVNLSDLDAYDHMVKGDYDTIGKIPTSGVSGAHNNSEFLDTIQKEADRLGISVEDFKVKPLPPNPDYPGIIEYTYEIPKINGAGKNNGKPILDKDGNVMTRIVNNPKTTYTNPPYTDSMIYELGRTTLDKEVAKGNFVYKPGNNTKVTGVAENGLHFEGWRKPDGTWESIYPIIPKNK